MSIRASAAVIAATAALLTAACERADEAPAQQRTATESSQAQSAETSDTAITTRVQAQYYSDDALRGRRIEVSTNDRVVTLRGTIPDEQARERAVRMAREVPGVSRVTDELKVAPAASARAGASESAEGRAEMGTRPEARTGEKRTAENERNPAWVTTKIQAQYFVNPDLKPWNIDVTTANNGVVTLAGEVDDANDREKAVQIARNTEGVSRVENQLRVRGEQEQESVGTSGDKPEGETAPAEPAGERKDPDMVSAGPLGDPWITSKIQSKYFMDDEIKGRNINVTTREGVVTLRGEVSSEGERRQAVALARNTDGVRNVQDELNVAAQAESAGAGAVRDWNVGGVENPFGDEWLTTKIQSKFFMDDTVKSGNINVESRDGVVSLTGSVQSAEAKKTAEQIARGTSGVKQVRNQLTVSPATRQ